jgi:hypothetical protein
MDETQAAEAVAAYAHHLEKNDLIIRMTALIGITVTAVAFFSWAKAEAKR